MEKKHMLIKYKFKSKSQVSPSSMKLFHVLPQTIGSELQITPLAHKMSIVFVRGVARVSGAMVWGSTWQSSIAHVTSICAPSGHGFIAFNHNSGTKNVRGVVRGSRDVI